MVRTQPSRAYDALYDPDFTVSDARDFYKEQSRGGAYVMERVPDFRNMFSELPTHPAKMFRFRNNDRVPAFVPREFHPAQALPADLAHKSTTHMVSGSQQAMYIKRPLLPPSSFTVPGLASLRQQLDQPMPESSSRARTPGPRDPLPWGPVTQGTQTDYRESDAQTDPYTPDYYIREGAARPDILNLEALKWGQGLPGKLPEVHLVEKLREKAAFEASLPPINDLSQMQVRKRMLEWWERKELAEREAEIVREQEEKLRERERQMEVRAANEAAALQERIQSVMQAKAAQRDRVLAAIQRRRIQALRKLSMHRQSLVEGKTGRDIVSEYSDYGSSVYAPATRTGRFTDRLPERPVMDPQQYEPVGLRALVNLEETIPPRTYVANAKRPELTHDRTAAARACNAVTTHLDHIDHLLQTSKDSGGRGYGDCWPAPTTSVSTNASARKGAFAVTERPQTPSLPDLTADIRRSQAVILLQRLLRGRAVQNSMYEGKRRRAELIRELQDARTPAQEEREHAERAHREADAAQLDRDIGLAVAHILNVLISCHGREQIEQLANKRAFEERKHTAAVRIQSHERGRQLRRQLASKQLMPRRGAQIMMDDASVVDAVLDSLISDIASKTQQQAEVRAAVKPVHVETTTLNSFNSTTSSEQLQERSLPTTSSQSTVMTEFEVSTTITTTTTTTTTTVEEVREVDAKFEAELEAEAEEMRLRTETEAELRTSAASPRSLAEAEAEARAAVAMDTTTTDAAKQAEAAQAPGGTAGSVTAAEYNTQGIVKIQATARGYLTRKELAAKKSSRSSIEPELVSRLAPKELAAIRKLEKELEKLEKKKEYTLEDEASVIKINELIREQMARLEVAQMRGELDQLDRLKDLTPHDSEQIVKIQSGIRGHLARKQTKLKRIEQEQEQKEALRVRREEAAMMIQSHVRGHLVRKHRMQGVGEAKLEL